MHNINKLLLCVANGQVNGVSKSSVYHNHTKILIQRFKRQNTIIINTELINDIAKLNNSDRDAFRNILDRFVAVDFTVMEYDPRTVRFDLVRNPHRKYFIPENKDGTLYFGDGEKPTVYVFNSRYDLRNSFPDKRCREVTYKKLYSTVSSQRALLYVCKHGYTPFYVPRKILPIFEGFIYLNDRSSYALEENPA